MACDRSGPPIVITSERQRSRVDDRDLCGVPRRPTVSSISFSESCSVSGIGPSGTVAVISCRAEVDTRSSLAERQLAYAVLPWRATISSWIDGHRHRPEQLAGARVERRQLVDDLVGDVDRVPIRGEHAGVRARRRVGARRPFAEKRVGLRVDDPDLVGAEDAVADQVAVPASRARGAAVARSGSASESGPSRRRRSRLPAASRTPQRHTASLVRMRGHRAASRRHRDRGQDIACGRVERADRVRAAVRDPDRPAHVLAVAIRIRPAGATDATSATAASATREPMMVRLRLVISPPSFVERAASGGPQ